LERRLAALTVIAIVILAFGVTPFREQRPDVLPGVFILDTALFWFCKCLIAVVLLARALLTREGPTATLAAGFAGAAVIGGVTLAASPSMNLWPHFDVALMCAFASRLLMLAGIAGYALTPQHSRPYLRRKLLAALTIAVLAALAAGLRASPGGTIVSASGDVLPAYRIANYLVMFAALGASALLLRRKREPTSLNLWAGVAAAVPFGFSVALIGVTSRLESGAMVARFTSTVFSFVVLTALTIELLRLLRWHVALRVRYEQDQEVSTALQSAFLPPFLPELDGVELQAYYHPASDDLLIGGDWYDAFVLRDGRLALSIGDVAGHGVHAVSPMIRLRETIRAVTEAISDEPSAVLAQANKTLMAAHPDVVASAAVVLFDPTTGQALLSYAGHPPPIVVSRGRSWPLPTSGPLLGVTAPEPYALQEIYLGLGDSLVLYTDGLIESTRDAIAGEARLLGAVLAADDEAAATIARVLPCPPRDDVAYLRLTVTNGVTTPWRFGSDDARSAHDARGAFTMYLRRRDLDERTIAVAELVFGELVANVVRHAPGPIEVELAWDASTPVLLVRDRGPAFTPGSFALPADALAEDGRGLYLIATEASPPVVCPRPGGGNEVIVRLAVTNPVGGNIRA
jgi:anti-sigma regulatory factor (Ser/Thr protein kinase)